MNKTSSEWLAEYKTAVDEFEKKLKAASNDVERNALQINLAVDVAIMESSLWNALRREWMDKWKKDICESKGGVAMLIGGHRPRQCLTSLPPLASFTQLSSNQKVGLAHEFWTTISMRAKEKLERTKSLIKQYRRFEYESQEYKNDVSNRLDLETVQDMVTEALDDADVFERQKHPPKTLNRLAAFLAEEFDIDGLRLDEEVVEFVYLVDEKSGEIQCIDVVCLFKTDKLNMSLFSDQLRFRQDCLSSLPTKHEFCNCDKFDARHVHMYCSAWIFRKQ